MILVIGVVALFVAISIYLYFRVENLQRDLKVAQKESHHARKESQQLIESLVAIASKYQEFAQQRLKQMTGAAQNEEHKELLVSLTIITPLINNYAYIFRECLKNGKLHKTVKACYERATNSSYQEFEIFIKRQDAALKKMWLNNHLTGYVALIEALLIKHANLVDKKVVSNSDQKSA